MIRPTVVVADDSSIMLGVAVSLIRACGYSVVASCSNGEEALSKVLELEPDLALLDYIMSPMTGAEAAEKIRAAGVKTKLIMTTSMGQSTAAYKPGMVDAVVIKPMSKPTLMLAIMKVFPDGIR